MNVDISAISVVRIITNVLSSSRFVSVHTVIILRTYQGADMLVITKPNHLLVFTSRWRSVNYGLEVFVNCIYSHYSVICIESIMPTTCRTHLKKINDVEPIWDFISSAYKMKPRSSKESTFNSNSLSLS